ncbi:hypothetical protein ACFV0D_22710 [Streptomyces sp. NPDC059556]|uniref:hypothetical protein n=1 Tax=Streptomyces sp. NPDC059556 TaxID=3346863 RepID=UPI0036B40BB4
MSGHFTDRDERMWQQRAEEWAAARPLRIGVRLRGLRNLDLLRAARGTRASRSSRPEAKASPVRSRPRPVEQP